MRPVCRSVTRAIRRGVRARLTRLRAISCSVVHAPADVDYTGPVRVESSSSAVVAPGRSDDGEGLTRPARSCAADQLSAGRR